jgi:hypothetical protein
VIDFKEPRIAELVDDLGDGFAVGVDHFRQLAMTVARHTGSMRSAMATGKIKQQ